MSLHPKRWQVAPPAPAHYIASFPHLNRLTAQVLYNRGIADPAEAALFLRASGGEANPFALDGVHAAVTRLRQALRGGEPLAVYGDFDADGVSATVLLVQVLRALGGNVKPYIPHRSDEGYGLHTEALTQLAHDGTRVVVTVDCGVRSLDEIEHANRVGLDVIVTDHHSVGPQLPDAVAVIDPKRIDGKYPFKDLAGVGVAFKLAQALLRSHRQSPITSHSVRLAEEDLIDLVALGTVADLVPLLGENRSLVHRGLQCANRMERPGIEALCRQAGLQPGQLDTVAIGFALGPRLNAAGRLAHAEAAYKLLETRYPVEAERLASDLDRLNRERQQLTVELYKRALQQTLSTSDRSPLLIASGPEYLAGVVGLVASRLVDDFYRPAIVLEVGEEVSTGSARSIPEFHITRALDECSDLLLRHGGHAAAAGLTVANENLEPLADRLRDLAARELDSRDLCPVISIDAEVRLSEMSWRLQQELTQLEPCGYDNPHPIFVSRNVPVCRHRAVGKEKRHLKLTLDDGNGTWDAIAFRQGEWAGKLPDRIDVVYRLEVNEWNNQRQLQLNVQDIRPTEDPAPDAWLDTG
jgi:single-stranded-DNA-specific exonuclease